MNPWVFGRTWDVRTQHYWVGMFVGHSSCTLIISVGLYLFLSFWMLAWMQLGLSKAYVPSKCCHGPWILLSDIPSTSKSRFFKTCPRLPAKHKRNTKKQSLEPSSGSLTLAFEKEKRGSTILGLMYWTSEQLKMHALFFFGLLWDVRVDPTVHWTYKTHQ